MISNGYLSAAVSLRMGSNPIADMSGWSHSARKRKLALSLGVALRSKQARLTCVAGVTGKVFGYRSATWLTLSLALRFQTAERD